MKLTITIQMDNAAFEGDPGSEAGRILVELIENLDAQELRPGLSETLRDVNGNTIGKAKVSA